MLKFIKIIKSSQRINRFSEILIHGEKELNFFKKYQKEGILLDKNSQKNLKEIFTDLNI
jgi:LDH2 family malate/lactate/ureidoglycolate dehydrogenase